MAQADTSIYQGLLRQPQSLIGNMNDIAAGDVTRAQAEGLNLNLIGQRQDMQDQQKLRQLYAQPNFDPNSPASLPSVFAISPKAGMAAQKAQLDAQQTQADIAHKNAQAGQAKQATAGAEFDLISKKLDHATSAIAASVTPDAARQAIQDSIQHGYFTPEEGQQKLASVPADPGQFQQWRQQQWQSVLAAKDALTLQQQQKQQEETARHNKAGEGIQIRGQNMADQRAQEQIKKDYAVAGMGADGTPDADVAATVKAIGEYRMKPPTLQALRNPRMAAIMNQVAQQYPAFDATQYDMRQKAVKDFGTGQQGQQVQAANTALNHLDTLAKLADAQKNNNVQLFNQIANEWGKQTGNPVPTNLQGAVTLVGPEISKAVVGAGGGVGDREKVDAALAALTKGSPQQQTGQIATMKEIFGGRLSEVGRTYKRSTGLDNFNEMLSPAAQQMLHARGGPAAGWKVEEVK